MCVKLNLQMDKDKGKQETEVLVLENLFKMSIIYTAIYSWNYFNYLNFSHKLRHELSPAFILLSAILVYIIKRFPCDVNSIILHSGMPVAYWFIK